MMAIKERLSSSDEAQDKAQTPSRLPLTNDETVFSAGFGVFNYKNIPDGQPLWPKKNKQINKYI